MYPSLGSESRKNRSSTPMSHNLSSDDDVMGHQQEHIQDDSLIGREGSFDINQIDARLSALQQYMNDLVT